MHSPLSGIGVLDLFEADPRPTFFALSDCTISWSNRACARLFKLDIASKKKHGEFWEWATGQDSPPTITYRDILWTRILVQGWVVISANDGPAMVSPQASAVKAFLGVNEGILVPRSVSTGAIESALPRIVDQRSRSFPTTPGEVEIREPRRTSTEPAWIVPDFIPEQEPFLDVINGVDWDTTPLGHPRTWPSRLQQTFNQILADSRPIAIYWGAAYTTIYNEAFSKICGTKHPFLLGKPVDAAWPEAGRRLKETMRSSAQKQRASVEDEWRFFVDKEVGCPEETYLRWSIIPIVESEHILGFLHSVVETTSMRLWERRMKMLIELGEVLVTARDVKSYWQKTLEGLEAVEPRYDIPLAILYSIEDDMDAASASDISGSHDRAKLCRLEGSLGVPEGHPIAPQTLVLRHTDAGLSPMFREALRTQYPLLLQTKDGSLPEVLLEGLQWRGFGDACKAAVVCPIRPTKDEDAMGMLVLGLNPRRPYDNDYRQHISLLAQKLTTSLASTVLFEEEARRGRNAAEQAAFDHEELKERLAVQTKEASESLQRFEAVAEFIPVGMCFGDYQGNITFANDAWYRITGSTYPDYPGDMADASWILSCVVEEDRPNITRAYEDLQRVHNVTFEFRVKRQNNIDSTAPSRKNSPSFERAGLDLVGIDALPPDRHVLASAKAERALDGSIVRVMTCLTDVTLHKHTAEAAVSRAQQAENLKRMAELATVGMYDMDLEGKLLGANGVFYEMCGLEKADSAAPHVKPLEKCVAEEDLPLLQESISKLVHEGRPQTAEIRFKLPRTIEDSEGNKVVVPRWVEATFMPVRSSEGIIQSFTGCLSDLSLQKWQLENERKRKEEALESKRQQENFIDMTSHEMRNPLSAIVHCADSVIASLARVQELGRAQSMTPSREANRQLAVPAMENSKDEHAEENRLVHDSLENAETIIACAQHQRRIVDDILTMSKLDSKLLAVTAITANPVEIVHEAVKMFEVEARRVDIDLSIVVDRSFVNLGIDFLDFDPSRVKQVLINLLTNALKFTVSGPIRNVTVTLGASRTKPTDAASSVQFIPVSEDIMTGNGTESRPVDRGDPIFLIFEVKDTGQGLSEGEKKSLFQRFVQASSRTHVKYGGSGLGLFISRRLTEMQNGAIGVASLPGVGSTFAFFIETYQPNPDALREAQAAADLAKLSLMQGAIAMGRSGSRGSIDRTHSTLGQTKSQAPDIKGVLVVEDNLINQQITRRGLVDRGFTVDVANHGLEALEKLNFSDRCAPDGEFPLSIILMDLEMPIQDGLTCTKNIRELEREGKIKGGRIPIIAVSANARMEQILEAKAAGCDDVLVKPFRMPELIEKMQVVTRRVWQEQEQEQK